MGCRAGERAAVAARVRSTRLGDMARWMRKAKHQQPSSDTGHTNTHEPVISIRAVELMNLRRVDFDGVVEHPGPVGFRGCRRVVAPLIVDDKLVLKFTRWQVDDERKVVGGFVHGDFARPAIEIASEVHGGTAMRPVKDRGVQCGRPRGRGRRRRRGGLGRGRGGSG